MEIGTVRDALGVIAAARDSGILNTTPTIGELATRTQDSTLAACIRLLPGNESVQRNTNVAEAERFWRSALNK